MSLVEKYVRKLLYEHDCVVLPELGGFIIHANHAFYSEQHQRYHAPQRRVAFNEALKLDDGLLVHYLTLNEPMSREEAQKQLRQYTESIKASIKENGHYELTDIGTLSANAEGKYVFEPQVLTNFLSEAYGFTSIAATTTQPALEVTKEATHADWTYTDREAESLPFELPRRRRSRAGWYAATALLVGALVLGSNVQLTSGSLKGSLNPFDLLANFNYAQKTNAVQSVVNEPVVSKAAPSVTPAPVAISPVAKVEKSLPAVVEALPVPAVSSQIAEVATPVSPRLAKGTASDADAQYWVMACAFAQRENAEKLILKLHRNGYEDAHLFNPEAPEGTLLKVAAVGFESRAKASRYRKAVSKLSGAQAWIVQK